MALISRILTTSSRGVLSSTSALPLRRTTFILRGPTPILLHTRNFSSGNDTAEQEEEAAARASFIGIPRDQKDRQVLISRPATEFTCARLSGNSSRS